MGGLKYIYAARGEGGDNFFDRLGVGQGRGHEDETDAQGEEGE